MLRGLSRRLIRRLARLLPAPQLRDGRDGDLRHYADVTVGRVLFWTVILLFALTISILVAVDQAGLSVGFLTDVLLLVLGGGLLGAAITFGLGARATVANILASTQLQRIY